MNNLIEKEHTRYAKIRFLDIYMVGHKGYIAGGCFKNIFNNEKIKDVDIFFHGEEDFTEALNYYKENSEYVFSYENKNTVAYKNIKTNVRIELVKSSFGSPDEMLRKFDFSITKFGYCKRTVPVQVDNQIVSVVEYYVLFHENFFDDLVNKKLVLEREILFPVSTFERSYRYVRYGYGLCRESKKNLLDALKTANTDNLSNELYFGFD